MRVVGCVALTVFSCHARWSFCCLQRCSCVADITRATSDVLRRACRKRAVPVVRHVKHAVITSAGDVRYMWPLTQPISDLDTQKKRMQQLRKDIGWSLIGCELVECYDEGDAASGGNWLSRQFKLR
jgi:hypothetical protein